MTVQVEGFSRADFRGFRTESEAEAYLYGSNGPAPVHSFQDNLKPAWQDPYQQQHEAVQQQYQSYTSASRHQYSSMYDDDRPPSHDCMIVDPDDLYRLVCPQ